MEVDQQPTGVPDGWEVVSAPARPTPPPSSDARPSVTARAGVPASGRGSQINPDQSMRGLELATTPLAHPTGIDAIDGMTSPVGIASLAAGGYGVARAGLTSGVAAGAKEALATAAPAVKYEATKTLLSKMGVPAPLAVTIAMMVSGYKKGAKGEPVVASNVPPAGVESAQEAAARMTSAASRGPAPVVEPVASAPAPPMPPPAAVAPPASPVGPGAQSVARAPMSAPPLSAPSPQPQAPPPDVMQRLSPATAASAAPSGPPAPRMGPDGLLVGRPGGNPDLPDQRALNEAALAARRAAAQAPPAAPAVTKPMLLAAEAKAYVKLLQSGKTAKEAMAAIEAQRAFQTQMGLTTPTAAETKFPKGMRGGLPK